MAMRQAQDVKFKIARLKKFLYRVYMAGTNLGLLTMVFDSSHIVSRLLYVERLHHPVLHRLLLEKKKESDFCLTPTQQFLGYIMTRTSKFSMR